MSRTREDMVKDLAEAIRQAIKDTQPKVCCYGEFPLYDAEGNKVDGATTVDYDGNFDLIALADYLFGRIS